MLAYVNRGYRIPNVSPVLSWEPTFRTKIEKGSRGAPRDPFSIVFRFSKFPVNRGRRIRVDGKRICKKSTFGISFFFFWRCVRQRFINDLNRILASRDTVANDGSRNPAYQFSGMAAPARRSILTASYPIFLKKAHNAGRIHTALFHLHGIDGKTPPRAPVP